jgi:hypothetical protein
LRLSHVKAGSSVDQGGSQPVTDESLIESIRQCVTSRTTSFPFEAASAESVGGAENGLGFPIPSLLKACYQKLGNGGFGPGYGLIGVEGGYESDYGDLLATYRVLKQDQESEDREWPTGLLPFCEWGCNIFSCVDCNDARHSVYTFEDFSVRPENYSLDKFFELWISGVDIQSYGSAEAESVEIINPFTGKKEIVSKHRRR